MGVGGSKDTWDIREEKNLLWRVPRGHRSSKGWEMGTTKSTKHHILLKSVIMVSNTLYADFF